MNTASMKKAFMAGMAGTVVMTVFAALSNAFHFPSHDIHGMIASHMGMVMSWVVYFGFGVVLAYVYGTFLKGRLPFHSWSRGVVYSLILYGVMGMVLMPVLGMGFFTGSLPTALGGLIGMASYGATVGYLYEH